MDKIRKNWEILSILVVSLVFRLWKLGTLPPGLHPDEAANGLDIINIIEKGQFAAIYDTNGPREALFFYLQAIPVWIGKVFHVAAINFTPLSLRIAPALIGALTVWAVYLLGKEMFNKNVGILAAAATAVSAWHIQFSRNGFRAIMAPLALCFTFYFLLTAYREKRTSYYIGLGASLALGFYTYLSFRMVPLVFGAILLYLIIKDRKFFAENLKKLLPAGGVFLLLMIPMFIHFYKVPADIAGRASTSIFNAELNNGSPLKTLGGNIVKTAMMFNFKGDENFRHNLGGTPMLDPVQGVLLWVGLVIIVVTGLSLPSFILIMWLGALSLPELLTAEGIPHALRIVGIMPVLFIAIGLGLDWAIQKLKAEIYRAVILVVFLLVSGAFAWNKYLVKFPKMGETGEAYAEDMVGIARDINQNGAERENILIVGEYGTKTVDYIIHSTKNIYTRYEVRDFEENLNLGENYKIYVQKDWATEANRKLEKYEISVQPVRSKIDGRVIYYEYEKN